MKILIFTDCHVGPDQSLLRFDKLAQHILVKKPDVIVQLGDFITIDSLSNWDMNKRLVMEGRRYNEDIAAGRRAINKIFDPIFEYNKQCARMHIKQYKPIIHWFLANHEDRVQRYVEQNPQLQGHVDVIKDLGLNKLPVNIVENKDYIEQNGILFTHSPVNAAGKLVSGKYSAFRVSDLVSMSTIFGHVHRLEQIGLHRHGSGKLIQILSCGAFFDKPDAYTEGSTENYWRGFVELDVWGEGRFDVTQTSLERLYEMY